MAIDKGCSPLRVGLMRGLVELGHWAEDYNPGGEYELVLMFNMCAHTTDYRYPDFPKDGQRIAFVDTAEYGWSKRWPDVAHLYQNLCSPGALDHDTKNRAEQERLIGWLEHKSFPYFIREYFDFLPWPGGYHPIDYPLYVHSVCRHIPNRDEYIKRTQDIFCSWGMSHPFRVNLTAAMRGMGLNGDIIVNDDTGRIGQGEYFQRMRKAKCGVSYDGYGSSSFRLTEIVVRSVLLRGPLCIKQYAALVNGVHCVDFDITRDGDQFVATGLPQKIAWVLEDPDRAFAIYEAGYHHTMQHLTEKAYAAYVLKTVAEHDYSQPTRIRL